MTDMRVYLLSLGAGLLVGIIYSLLSVRSPAPPVVALVGLLGILVGEQIIPVAKHMVEGSHLAAAWHKSQVTPHIFGRLPGRHEQVTQAKIDPEPEHTHDEAGSDR
jgi:XapX domain-containing protein